MVDLNLHCRAFWKTLCGRCILIFVMYILCSMIIAISTELIGSTANPNEPPSHRLPYVIIIGLIGPFVIVWSICTILAIITLVWKIIKTSKRQYNDYLYANTNDAGTP
jgi:hypothetical protein